MPSSSKQERVATLHREIHTHNHRYHVLQAPLISDGEFDTLMNELRSIEELHPELITRDSPTQRVGGRPSDKLGKVRHPAPILSLGNAYGASETRTWFDRISRLDSRVNDAEFVVEPKIDGLTVVLHYQNGVFFQGATRGDGEVGEDITINLRTIRSLPLRIPIVPSRPVPMRLVVRGEAYMPRRAFAEWNRSLESAGERTYISARNAASGALRQLDPRLTTARPISLLCYQVVHTEGSSLGNQWETLEYLRAMGFPVSDVSTRFQNLDSAVAYCKSWAGERDTLDYEIDGMVIKIDDLTLQVDLGVVGKDPRGAVAFKFPALEVTTILTDVGINVGRTGVLTPYAILQPVKVSGVTVKQATLHNFDFIAEKDIRIGDHVIIKRAGEVIPYVIGPSPESRDGREQPARAPSECPECSAPVARRENEVAIYCTNSACPAQLKRNLEYFVSRGSLEIEGFGEKLASQFVDAGIVRDVADVFSITKAQLLKLEGFADRKAQGLVDAISSAKSRSLDRLIIALGIRGVGQVIAVDLAARFGSLGALARASVADLETEEGIGTKISHEIVEWFSQASNQRLLRKLKQAGCWPEAAVQLKSEAGFLVSKTFVLTGTLPNWSRNQARDFIMRHGGRVAGVLSKSTNFLVVGNNPGRKRARAKAMGIPELDEDALRALAEK